MVFGEDGGRVHVTASVFKTGISVEGNEKPLLLGLGSELNAGKRHAKAWKEEKANRSWWLTHPTFSQGGPALPGLHIMSKIWAQFEAVEEDSDLRYVWQYANLDFNHAA